MKKDPNFFKRLSEIEKGLQQKNHLEVVEAVSKSKKLLDEFKSRRAIEFPVEAFPKTIQYIIQEFQSIYKFPVDYYSLGILMASSTAIGNNYVAEYFPGWSAPALLYGVIIANSGVGKSNILKHCLTPINTIHESYKKEYLEDLEEWEIRCEELDRKKGAKIYPTEPKQKRIITNNATTESLYGILQANPQGILLKRDELKGFIGSMNQYRKGGDGEFWLEVFDNDTAMIDRVGKLFDIPRVYINILGCMQPGITKVLAEDNGRENGFLARFLFAYPDNLEKPAPRPPHDLPDTRFMDLYATIIEYINYLPSKIRKENKEWHIESIALKLNKKAQMIYHAFLKTNTEEQNKEPEELIKAIYAKMDTYALRLALNLELLNWACDKVAADQDTVQEEIEGLRIGEKTMTNALKMIAYFKSTALKVVNKLESPVSQMSTLKASWYSGLKEGRFNSGYAAETGAGLQIGRSTIYNYLNDRSIFIKHGRGLYEKRFL